MDPPVSLPRAASHMPAATAAALPPDEPPGTLSRSRGFLVQNNALCVVSLPHANSSIFAEPIMIASSFTSLSMTVALYGAT